MYSNMFDGLITFILILCMIAALGLGYMGYDLIFGNSDITSDKPIRPELKLIIKDNKVDTLYIYKKP